MAHNMTHITALRCGTGVPVGAYCWPGEDDALPILQACLPKLGALQLLEQGVRASEQPLVWQWRVNGVAMAWQRRGNGSQWRGNGVAMAWQWRGNAKH